MNLKNILGWSYGLLLYTIQIGSKLYRISTNVKERTRRVCIEISIMTEACLIPPTILVA